MHFGAVFINWRRCWGVSDYITWLSRFLVVSRFPVRYVTAAGLAHRRYAHRRGSHPLFPPAWTLCRRCSTWGQTPPNRYERHEDRSRSSSGGRRHRRLGLSLTASSAKQSSDLRPSLGLAAVPLNLQFPQTPALPRRAEEALRINAEGICFEKYSSLASLR